MPIDAAQQATLNAIIQGCMDKYPECNKCTCQPYAPHPEWHNPACYINLKDSDARKIDDCVVAEFHSEGVKVIYNIFHGGGECFAKVFTVDYGASDLIEQVEKLVTWAINYLGTETEPNLDRYRALYGPR